MTPRHLSWCSCSFFRQQGLAAPDGPRLLSTTFVQTAMRSHWSSPWYYSRAECSAFSAPSAQGYGYRFQLYNPDWVCAHSPVLRPLRVLLADSRHLVRAHRHERLHRWLHADAAACQPRVRRAARSAAPGAAAVPHAVAAASSRLVVAAASGRGGNGHGDGPLESRASPPTRPAMSLGSYVYITSCSCNPKFLNCLTY